MKGPRIASRYAKSLLILCQEKNAVDAVLADMEMVGNTITGSRDLELLLLSPVIKTDTKVKVLDKVFGNHVGEITKAFMTLLTNKGRESMLSEIATSFVAQVKEFKNIVTAKVISAAPFDAETQNVVKALAEKLAAGKSIELEQKIDADLIGGFVLTVGDHQVDASVSGEIKNLRREFEKNPYVPEF
ncbi:MAG: ATP synthase F1 subunit delta [Flavobacteriales bacterium]